MLLIFIVNMQWVIRLKDKKGSTITNTFQKVLHHKSNTVKRKPNKIWENKYSEFYNRSMKSRLQDNIEMFLTHDEEKLVIAEGFI